MKKPHGNAFSTKKTLIENEQEGARTIDPSLLGIGQLLIPKRKLYGRACKL